MKKLGMWVVALAIMGVGGLLVHGGNVAVGAAALVLGVIVAVVA